MANANWYKNYRKIHPTLHRKHHLKQYGITVEDFEAQRIEQDNKCAICLKEFTQTPCVDHSHVTFEFRGLLCHKCNRFIGLAEENIDSLERAKKYLLKYGVDHPNYQRAYKARNITLEDSSNFESGVWEDYLS